ncbi:MAG: hypothetical protein V4719_00955 [Planctomycetota bacterium]
MANAAEYPKRPSFFAYKLTRMMFKTALANEIGPEACHLIIQIAHTEDAGRYSKAVTFYNEQLLPVCGFTNVKSLDRARAKAVKSGWLVYIAGGKSKAGKYWTQIPEQYIFLDDTQIDESNSSTELQATTHDATCLPVAGKETGDKREVNGRQEPDKREVNARETPEKRATIYPVPNPTPCPKETPPNPQGGKSSRKVAAEFVVVIPESLQTPLFVDAWEKWQKHRREIRKPLTETQAGAQMAKFKSIGEARAVASIDHTIAMGWQGIREPDGTSPQPRGFFDGINDFVDGGKD